jgi:hypothetical protein
VSARLFSPVISPAPPPLELTPRVLRSVILLV